jgi:pyruvate dehydrogenase E2 component (dihydrolipoamide acetyltransferase)
MQGGSFSISSLGGIGGTTSRRSSTRPKWRSSACRSRDAPGLVGKQFVPRLMLPLSLSYDHRVIDGAQGARFITFLNGVLTDIRRLVL